MLSLECVFSVSWREAEKALAEAGVRYIKESSGNDFLFQVLRAMDSDVEDMLLETADQFSEGEKLAILSQFSLCHENWLNQVIRDMLSQIGIAGEVQAENIRIQDDGRGKMMLTIGRLNVHFSDLIQRQEVREWTGLPEWVCRILSGISGTMERQALNILESHAVHERLIKQINDQLISNNTGLNLEKLCFSYPENGKTETADMQLWTAMQQSIAVALAGTLTHRR